MTSSAAPADDVTELVLLSEKRTHSSEDVGPVPTYYAAVRLTIYMQHLLNCHGLRAHDLTEPIANVVSTRGPSLTIRKSVDRDLETNS